MKPARFMAACLTALCLATSALAQDVKALATPAPSPAPSHHPADEPDAERLRVADPYLEMHTGPGRGFPVFHVAERGAWVRIELRHTEWFKVRASVAANGRRIATPCVEVYSSIPS